jgi:hypothetical protein
MTHPIISTKTATLALLRFATQSFVVQALMNRLALRSPTLASLIPKTPLGRRREPMSGIEPETSPFVYTSPYGRTRLYLYPSIMDTLVSRSGQKLSFRPRSCPLLGILTVIRDSSTRYHVNGQGLTTYQWRALPTELHRLITSNVTVRFYDPTRHTYQNSYIGLLLKNFQITS